MTNGIMRFQRIIELQELAERAFLYKLKKKSPNLTQDQISAEVYQWYRVRPGAEHGDGEGRPGDISRFDISK